MQFAGEHVAIERKTCRQALDDHHERLTVRLAGCQKPQHRGGDSIELSATLRPSRAAIGGPRSGVVLAARARVWVTLAGDRFLHRRDDVWVDLVTGRLARVVFHHLPRDWIDRAAALERELFVPRPDGTTLLDFGRMGSSVWFEARARAVRQSRGRRLDDSTLAAAVRVCDAAPGVGFRSVSLDPPASGPSDEDVSALARLLRARGHVAVRPGVDAAGVVQRTLCGRHVALVCCDDRDAARAAPWIRRLGATSPRAHLACLLTPRRRGTIRHAGVARAGRFVPGRRSAESVGGPGRSALEAAVDEPWQGWLRAAGQSAVAREARGDVAGAMSLLGAVMVEAEVCGRAVPQRLRALHDRLTHDEYRRRAMQMPELVPALLRAMHEAEDDGAALKAAVALMRKTSGARGAAIVSSDRTRVFSRDGWLSAPPAGPATAGASTVARESLVARFEAPVRYGGTMIGSVVAETPGGPGDRLVSEAVHALAMVAGPAIHGRLLSLGTADASGLMPEIIGRGPLIAAVRDSVRRAAATLFPVLIEGESGTGKELVARALHRLSARRTRPFSAVNCAALSDDLVEAELFGFARGAFTGAVAPRAGLFEDANGGSIFLDEIGDLSARAQAKLLRALQEREVRRVGENRARPIDVRVIAATNVPLAEAVRAGRFRQDLLFRLAVVRIQLPPLRDRLEDVRALATTFWARLAAEAGKRSRLGNEALAALCRYSWPGNVRELQNVIASLAVAAPARGQVSARLVAQQLSADSPIPEPETRLEVVRHRSERLAVARALARHGGRRTAAARELGLSRQGLAKAMRRLRLDDDVGSAGVA